MTNSSSASVNPFDVGLFMATACDLAGGMAMCKSGNGKRRYRLFQLHAVFEASFEIIAAKRRAKR
ncbi:hypothetical protein BN1184_BN_00940 [Pantoea ananatis]|nr:hypothetical protein BN1184_BN_00940 [Pantoea ananatis]